MWKVTIFHFLIIMMIGLTLYGCLLYASGLGRNRYIRVRSKKTVKNRQIDKVKIIITYIIVLYSIIALCFLFLY